MGVKGWVVKRYRRLGAVDTKGELKERDEDMSKIDEIRERMENASFGKWKTYKNEDGVCIGTEEDHPQLKAPVPIVGIAIRVKKPSRQVWINDQNAEFISHSKTDMELLLKEIDRLHTELEVYQDKYYSEDVQKATMWVLDDSKKRLGIED